MWSTHAAADWVIGDWVDAPPRQIEKGRRGVLSESLNSTVVPWGSRRQDFLKPPSPVGAPQSVRHFDPNPQLPRKSTGVKSNHPETAQTKEQQATPRVARPSVVAKCQQQLHQQHHRPTTTGGDLLRARGDNKQQQSTSESLPFCSHPQGLGCAAVALVVLQLPRLRLPQRDRSSFFPSRRELRRRCSLRGNLPV